MNKTINVSICKWIMLFLTFIAIAMFVPSVSKMSASAYQAVSKSIGPGGGKLTYTSSVNSGVNKIEFSPESMFDIANTKVSGNTLNLTVRYNTGAVRTGTVKLYKNGILKTVVTVSQNKIIMEVTELSVLIGSNKRISGKGESIRYRLKSNVHMTGYLGNQTIMKTTGTECSGYSDTWTKDVTLTLPAYSASGSSTSDNHPTVVFVAGGRVYTFSYVQAPKEFLFGAATANASFGSVCYDGWRYDIRVDTDSRIPYDENNSITMTNTEYNWWNMVCCDFGDNGGGIGQSTKTNGLAAICSILRQLGNVRKDVSIRIRFDGDFAYIQGTDSDLHNWALYNAGFTIYNSESHVIKLDENRKKGKRNEYNFYVNENGKLCQALNLYKNDIWAVNGVTQMRWGLGYHPTSGLYPGGNSPFPPFYITDQYYDVLRKNGLYGSYK